MCGIAGILHFDGEQAASEAARAMARSLAHRGPDGEGVYASGSVALSFRRLSIIDLTDAASQPMSNEDGSVWLVFNGEIYNYLELMAGLHARGHRLRSHGDSEVILHSYEDEGPDCVLRFNGMWAFAIWDTRRRRLMLSRDRLGEKPLYYVRHENTLLFGSEVKALLSVRPELAEVDLPGVARFLAHGETDARPETLFRAVRQVPPGTTLLFEADGTCRTTKYWQAPEPGEVEPISTARAVSTFRELLVDSVRLRLRSDVPVGVGLSGGVDSTSLVAIMSDLMDGKPVHTFSSVVPSPRLNEGPFIASVNAAFPTVPHLTTPPPDFLASLPRILWHQEVPFTGPGVHAQWCLMELCRGKVKVLLDGQGADEILGGYFYYYSEHLADILRGAWWPPAWVVLSLALARVVRRSSPMQGARHLKEALRRAQGLPRPATFQQRDFSDFLAPDLAATLSESAPSATSAREGFLSSVLHHDVTYGSLPRLLRYEDRNSMAHGIESRVPYLDHRVVEFCLRLPDRLRINAGETKAVLRRAFKEDFPKPVRSRVDKKGFSEPLEDWIRGMSGEQVADILLSQRAVSRGITRRDRVETALAEHRAGLDRSVPLYRLLSLELWFRIFQDREPVWGSAVPGDAAAVPVPVRKST